MIHNATVTIFFVKIKDYLKRDLNNEINNL